VAQEAEDQAGGDAQVALGLAIPASSPRSTTWNGDAAVGVGLGSKNSSTCLQPSAATRRK
jgi:hypothetical protein